MSCILSVQQYFSTDYTNRIAAIPTLGTINVSVAYLTVGYIQRARMYSEIETGPSMHTFPAIFEIKHTT